ncbi:MAG: FKBP-type peptidyl-prolyl cis-trans isomerase SlyD (EC [uncultured Sulfurovum sp.]|uniref:peptidylprolyl isomerase n=1 Tax=uncultured Sulfurovum sp. TaxID=269237 RepID=A0A6S6TV07_9BACT|nr:MAG: FKBP-type peptidyl-prolyl cis-trans isomerase SlyD (EC [uncultured Sulfurovum sp.]
MNIKKNAMVSISMTLSDDNGNIIEDNEEEIIYLHGGYGHLFQKLEEELEGKTIGDAFTVNLKPSEAFGEFNEDLVSKEMLSDLPDDIEVGMELDGDLDGVIFNVLEVDETHALIDGNHPYAGFHLIATGNILEIEHLDDETIAKVLEEEHHAH